jgi:[acyl-carrier-protein] S-malonyltransferase
MQEAVPVGEGGMAALLGLDAAAVDALCAEAAGGGVLVAANRNGAGQIVISGTRTAVDRAVDLALARGARHAARLPVSAPFHTPLMAAAAAKVGAALAVTRVADARVPVVSNVDAAPHVRADELRERLVRQITAPVEWEASVRALAAGGVTRTLELGAGATLSALVRRTVPGLAVTAVGAPAEVRAAAGLVRAEARP